MKKSNLLLFAGLVVVLSAAVAFFHPMAGLTTFVGLGLVGTRFSDPLKANSFDAQGGGINSTGATPIAYAAVIALPTPVRNGLRHYYDFAQLTGALTLNVPAGAVGSATVVGLQEGDEVILRFSADVTGRTITWGTLIRSTAATLVLGASAFAVVHCFFMDGKLTVVGSGVGA